MNDISVEMRTATWSFPKAVQMSAIYQVDIRMRPEPENCPKCGSERLAKIFYGLPGRKFMEELAKNRDNPKYVCGGCLVAKDKKMPRWRCLECQHEWGVANS